MNWIILAMSQPGSQGASPLSMLLPLLGMLAIFYFLLIRPQQKKQKDLQRMIEALRKGDRVMTNGGIFGTVVGFRDNILVLKIADEVKIEILKSAVSSVVERKQD
jgi:preprotein translocase subunit YajC